MYTEIFKFQKLVCSLLNNLVYHKRFSIISSLSIISLFFLIQCIEPFSPRIENQESNKYVVNGLITDQEGYQVITISLTSSVENPHYIPLTNCNVQINSDDLKIFTLTEFKDGAYRVWMDSIDIRPGLSFRLSVVTPSGIEIESDLEKMSECPRIDSIYASLEEHPTNNPNKPNKGIQLYIDVNGLGTDCQHFRWELEETYEYHVPYPKKYFYDGEIKVIRPPDYSKSICWSNLLVKTIYTLSIKNIENAVYKKHSLNFVDNQSPRLLYVYSLLVKQFGLSEAAFTFWEQMRINSNERGGLYETQPLPIKGNLHNITNQEQNVLGFFEVSSVKTRRIFISNVEGLEIEYSPFCSPQILLSGFADIEEREYPAYFIWVDGMPALLQESCVDCRVFGGTIIKPDYWPN